MIRVEIGREGALFSLTVRGHAGYAPEGLDIVCAGASTLFFTLLRAVRRMDGEGAVAAFDCGFTKGEGCVEFEMKDWAAASGEAAFDAICCGFALLEENYPQYVECVDMQGAFFKKLPAPRKNF